MSASTLTPGDAGKRRVPGGERHALVIEDDIAIRLLAVAILRRQGFTVDAVVDGAEALALLAVKRYAVIVLDLTLPASSGLELIDYLHRRDAQTLRHVVVITTTVAARRPELPAEICHILTKPFQLDAFQAALADCAADAAR